MARTNDKKKIVNYDNSIKKSNEISMAKLNYGLTLNQMQLLAFAIFSTQKNGTTKFIKADFERKFGIERYPTKNAKEDVKRISSIQFSVEDLENDYFEYCNIFNSIKYQKGTFIFKWNEEFIPHILELKEKYVTTDLSITAKFRSEFSWVLYDFLKAHYGYWHRQISKEALMKLFGVEDKKTYQANTSRFKATVLDVAISEINQYTELEVWYKDKKKGRAIIGFDIYWSTGEKLIAATEEQIVEIQNILEIIHENMFKYIDLNDSNNRQRAAELIRRTEEISIYIDDSEPIGITKTYADKLILESKMILKELEELRKAEQKGVVFYNWLDERG